MRSIFGLERCQKKRHGLQDLPFLVVNINLRIDCNLFVSALIPILY